eukprot:228361-Rhodomonas_salina.2
MSCASAVRSAGTERVCGTSFAAASGRAAGGVPRPTHACEPGPSQTYSLDMVQVYHSAESKTSIRVPGTVRTENVVDLAAWFSVALLDHACHAVVSRDDPLRRARWCD